MVAFCRRILFIALVVPVFLLTGCGGGENVGTHVKGMVFFNGKPVPVGMVIFEPDAGKGNTGQQGHATIKDGKFDTKAGGKGVAVGAQLVRVTGGDGVNAEAFTPLGNMLFEEYQVNLAISKDQPDLKIEVPRQGQKK